MICPISRPRTSVHVCAVLTNEDESFPYGIPARRELWFELPFVVLMEQKKKKTKKGAEYLRVQWKASLLLKVLLHWEHWAARPELTGVNTWPFTIFLSFSLPSLSFSLLSRSFSCTDGILVIKHSNYPLVPTGRMFRKERHSRWCLGVCGWNRWTDNMSLCLDIHSSWN